MSREKQIEEMAKDLQKSEHWYFNDHSVDFELDRKKTAENLYNAGYRKQEWISVEERLPSEDEYLTHHNDRLSSLKRITIAYMTDTVEYTIGCYDGYKWMNQLGNKKIENVVAWKPFETYEPPKMKGGGE